MLTYVLDTNVLLSEGKQALYEFEGADVVIPSTVLMELDSKKSDPGLGYTARSVIGEIYEIMEGTVGERFSRLGEGYGRLILSFEATAREYLPEDFPENNVSSDAEILAHCFKFAKSGNEVVLVTKDRQFSIIANAFGIDTEDLTINEKSELDTHIKDVRTEYIDDDQMDDLYEKGSIKLELSVPCNIGLILKTFDDRRSALVISDKRWSFNLVRESTGTQGRNAEQNIAVSLLENNEIGVVSLSGPAGSGKSYLALAKAVEMTQNDSRINKVIVYRPINPVGGKEQAMGFLPGTQEEKMAPHIEPISDTLESLYGTTKAQQIMKSGVVKVDGVAFVRGRTINNTCIIVEEAQNLEYATLLTLLTRAGNNSRVILVWDMSQRDNQYILKTDGVHKVVKKLFDQSIFGHVALKKSERSKISEVVVSLLDEL